jgi:prepilin-type N-terminal cleavage/methylation domain-containing protein
MRRRRPRGYTVVELMAALAVFATGVTGVIAMQRATLSSNHLARNVALATGIADAWLGELAADATLWDPGAAGVTTTNWLSTLGAAGVNGTWQRPAWNATRSMGPEFDPVGTPIASNGVFCTHTRLTWLYRDGNGGGIAGNGAIRTEVRVFWPRAGVTRVAGDCTNSAVSTVDAVTAAIARGDYHVITQVSAVRQSSEAL